MSIKKLSKEGFSNLVDSIIKTQKVYGVQAKSDKFDYDVLTSSKDLRLDYDVTLQAPRKYFQPPVETLLTFEKDKGYSSVMDCEKFVLLGIHPYDVAALNQMDKIFSQDNYDTHYMARRENATIIACDVVKASKNVFASSMGTAVVKSGFDVLLTDIDNGFVVEAATEKGEQILAMAKGAADASKKDLADRELVWDKNKNELNKHALNFSSHYIPKLLERGYSHKIWEEKAKTCFSCGSCNQVCPTCYCFNVIDDMNWDMKSGKRERSWDGCLLEGFTLVAGEHEFRKNKAGRFRHRLYRKGKYVPSKIDGEIACVGCGRCVGACLPDIANPVKVYNSLFEEFGIG